MNSLKRALFIPTDLATKFIDSSYTSAWEVFELFAEDLVSIEVNEEGIKTTAVKECEVEYRKTFLHWIALFDSEKLVKLVLKVA